MRQLLLVVLLASACWAQGPVLSRGKLYGLLRTAGLLDADRKLVHLHQTCNLRIDGRWFPVVDVQEIIPAAMTARSENRVIVLDARGKVVQKFEYGLNRPLFCVAEKLFVYGDLRIDGVAGEGNVLTFRDGGARIELSHVEPQNYPVADTKKRLKLEQ